MSLLTKLDFSWNIESLLGLLPYVIWDDKNRCDLNQPTGHWLYDPYEVKKEWRDTEFGKLLSVLPFEIGEARLMRLSAGACYCAHADIDDRYHLNITGDNSILINLENYEIFKMFKDGIWYEMDAGIIHSAVNFGQEDRYQLVVRKLLKKNLPS